LEKETGKKHGHNIPPVFELYGCLWADMKPTGKRLGGEGRRRAKGVTRKVSYSISLFRVID